MDARTLSIPIFPLPNIVFYPNTLLPLHIFEPRYKEMAADCLAADKIIGIAQLRPGWENNYYGNPPVYRTLGIGEIVDVRKWDDGRYDIVLAGQHRGQIIKETIQGNYRIAEVEIMEEFIAADDQSEADNDYQGLLRVYQKITDALPDAIIPSGDNKWLNPPPGALADIMASALIENAYEKQCILSELDVGRRLKLVKVQMRTMLGAQ